MKTEKLFKTPLSDSQQENTELNLQERTEGRTVLKSFPRRIVFELTNKCNFNCIMCGREAADFRTFDLPMQVIKSAEHFFSRTEEVTLHGWGEGTLHRQLPEILKYLNGFPRLRKYFVTNGSTLPRIMDHIFEHHVDLVAMSLDGAKAATNDSIRTGGSLERELRSVRRLVEEKAARGLDYPYVNFVFTAMKRNISEVPDMVTLAAENGIPEVKVVYLTIFEEKLMDESLVDCQDAVREAFDEAKARARKLDINLKLPEVQGTGEAGLLAHKPCAFPWRDMYIGSDGYIRPCQSTPEKLANISDFKTLEEAWNCKGLQEYRKTVNDPATMPQGCRSCYHSTCANWNLRSSFLQLERKFAPEWKMAQEPADAKCGLVPSPENL